MEVPVWIALVAVGFASEGWHAADHDGDGWPAGSDCDDYDRARHPRMVDNDDPAQVGVDNDCDGIIDGDTDHDGDGVTTAEADCDDEDASVGGPETEILDGLDNDCDGVVDDPADLDGDGVTDIDGDCDDEAPSVHPGATELVGDETDQDCDGYDVCFVDADADGYTAGTTMVTADFDCFDAEEAYFESAALDCDDTNAGIYPKAIERIDDGIDSDCDGFELCFLDVDADGYTPSLQVRTEDLTCTEVGVVGASAPVGDCDDRNPDVHPSAAEVVGDGIDQDCDGMEDCFADNDRDGRTDGSTVGSSDGDCYDDGELPAGAPAIDCDDEVASTFPGAPDECDDGVDDNCDGAGGPDGDEDGDGLSFTEEQAAGSSDCPEDATDSGQSDSDQPTRGNQPKDETGAPADAGCFAENSASTGFFGLLAMVAAMFGGARRRPTPGSAPRAD